MEQPPLDVLSNYTVEVEKLRTTSGNNARTHPGLSPADSKMPAPHSHDAFEETIYGLEGVYDLKG